MHLFRKLTGFAVLVLALLISPASLVKSSAYTQSVLYTFCSSLPCLAGAIPAGPVIEDGNILYGMTQSGGTHGAGVIYSYDLSTGTYTVLASAFGTGVLPNQPAGSLIIDTSGNLYGIAQNGGVAGGGEVFELQKPAIVGDPWVFRTVYAFCSVAGCTDGQYPDAGLTYAGASSGTKYDGTSLLFGTTSTGGADNHGTVYALQLSGSTWSEKVIRSFKGSPTDGDSPNSTMWMDGSNNLWGTTELGGSAGKGIVFKLHPRGDLWTDTWSYGRLYNFCWTNVTKCPDGSSPNGVIMDASGNLLGTTAVGGSGQQSTGNGVVFKLNNGSCTEGGTATFWCNTVLYNFCPSSGCADGSEPAGLITMDSSGNLLGTTALGGSGGGSFGGGTAFKLDTSHHETVLYNFCSATNCSDGQLPASGAILDASGNLYGTTFEGGSSRNDGVLFKIAP